MANGIILEMTGISKRFPGVRALDDVSLIVTQGEVHALLGENGAGKSTLIKILAGIYDKDAGRICVRGQEATIRSPKDAERLGISFIHQEQNVVQFFTVGRMMFLGREPRRGSTGMVDWRRLYAESDDILEYLGADFSSREIIRNLSTAERQIVAIGQALLFDAGLIVLDEPTAPLGNEEVRRLFEIVRGLKKRGISVLYISHRLEEIYEIADRATILKDGKLVGTVRVKETSTDSLVGMMIGRDVGERFPKEAVQAGKVLLSVKNLTKRGMIGNISFEVHEGEILGILGLVGAGKTELAKTLFGSYRKDAGEISVAGKTVRIRAPQDAIRTGIGFVPEDRRGEGIIPELSVGENITLASLSQWLWGNFILRVRREIRAVTDQIRALSIRTTGRNQLVKDLSGGNQQKVAVSKWLIAGSRVYILDCPTVGVDVGSKTEMYRLMVRLAKNGAGIVLISQEIPEIINMCDRILVMYKGGIVGEFRPEATNPEELLAAAMGGA